MKGSKPEKPNEERQTELGAAQADESTQDADSRSGQKGADDSLWACGDGGRHAWNCG